MKVLLLANAGSSHTWKWAISLFQKGIEIRVVSLSDTNLKYDPAIQIYLPGFCKENSSSKGNDFIKLKYLRFIKRIKYIIKDFQPDIVHCHYATSYGILGALSNFHPLIISVWGSDIYEFPNKTILHKLLIKYNLAKADKVLSTSMAMADETNKYTDHEILVTPFGIDTDLFKKMSVERPFDKADVVIGTIKSLEDKYGIDNLIKAFNILVKKFPDMPLKLLIVGGGSQEKQLRDLANSLGISDLVFFTGRVEYVDIPVFHNMIDVFVALSKAESFGVAVIEASACEIPVVVSSVGGLPEVVENEVTGLIVPANEPEAAAFAMSKLVLDQSLRQKMGYAGRERVKSLYGWNNNLDLMISIYNNIIIDKKT